MIGGNKGCVAVGHRASKHTHPERFLDGEAAPSTIGKGDKCRADSGRPRPGGSGGLLHG